MQKLYQIFRFSLIKSNQFDDLDENFLENIVLEVKYIVLIMTSLVLSIGFLSKSYLTFHLVLIKFLIILVIICMLAYQNNFNYISLFIAIYIYSLDIKVDVIISSLN